MEKSIKSFDGTRIAYYDNNLKSEKIILFVHGWTGNRTHWKNHFIQLKKKGFRVLALDLRGYGRSEDSKNKNHKSSYSFKTVAKDINEILAKEGIPQIILAGYSMGGMISLIFYSMFPRKVEKLILASTSPRGPESQEHKDALIKFVKSAEQEKIEGKKGNKNVDFTKYNFLFSSIDAALGAPHPTLVYLENILEFDAEKLLSKIKVPTLIIAGKTDAVIPLKFSQVMKEKIKHNKCVTVDFGHSFIVKNPLARHLIYDFILEKKC